MISFNQISANIRTPGAYVEFDASRAQGGLPQVVNRVLIIGQKLAAGTAPQLVPQRVNAEAQADLLFGKGSIAARAYAAFRKADRSSECYVVGMTDLVGGTQATSTITVTGPATAAGTIALMIAGQRVAVGVANASIADTVAAAIAAAVNANTSLPVTAAAVAAVVTLTARHKGTAGNDIDVRHSYYQGEALPAGIALAFAAVTPGAGDPDYAPLWPALGEVDYRTIILAHHSAAVLASVEAELASRWGPQRMQESFCWTAKRGDLAALIAFGPTRNSELVSDIGTGLSPTPPWEWAGAYGGIGGYYTAIDPARPLNTLTLPGVLPPAPAARLARADREALLNAGVATYNVGSDGNVAIERTVTSYQKDGYAQPSTAFLDAETVLTLSYLRIAVRSRFLAKFPRYKLANDNTRFGPGQAIVTPSVLRGELLALMRECEEAGLVENLDQFKADLIVERDANDPNRVNALVPPDLVNQFRVFAAQIQFRV